jgi:hypothetical protein
MMDTFGRDEGCHAEARDRLFSVCFGGECRMFFYYPEPARLPCFDTPRALRAALSTSGLEMRLERSS